MARFLKKRKQDIGLSPDELIFKGKQKAESVLLRTIDFNDIEFEEITLSSVKDVLQYRDRDSVTWFNIDGLHHTEILEEISRVFELDNLIIADVMNTDARPKIQEYENCIFISIKMLQLNEESDTISVENLSLVLMDSILISFQEKKGDVFEPVRERIRKQKKRIRNSGTDYLTFALLDIVIDNYLYILSHLGEKIEALEENLLSNPTDTLIEDINVYKRELNFLRKNLKPAKEMIMNLAKFESELIEDSADIHFKELQNNINHASETSDSFREILSDQLNIYHTTINSKLNDIMKFLTIFSVIFIPITFIAGIYGTNFDYIPELHYKAGYFVMWGVILSVVIGMLIYFKKRKWL